MISPRVPMTSSRTTLFCFGDGPLFLGAQCPNPRMATRHLRVMTPRLRETATALSTGPYQKAQHAECEDATENFSACSAGSAFKNVVFFTGSVGDKHRQAMGTNTLYNSANEAVHDPGAWRGRDGRRGHGAHAATERSSAPRRRAGDGGRA